VWLALDAPERVQALVGALRVMNQLAPPASPIRSSTQLHLWSATLALLVIIPLVRAWRGTPLTGHIVIALASCLDAVEVGARSRTRA
jgi:hypothetical protein